MRQRQPIYFAPMMSRWPDRRASGSSCLGCRIWQRHDRDTGGFIPRARVPTHTHVHDIEHAKHFHIHHTHMHMHMHMHIRGGRAHADRTRTCVPMYIHARTLASVTTRARAETLARVHVTLTNSYLPRNKARAGLFTATPSTIKCPAGPRKNALLVIARQFEEDAWDGVLSDGLLREREVGHDMASVLERSGQECGAALGD